jgi:hypothetical protein
MSKGFTTSVLSGPTNDDTMTDNSGSVPVLTINKKWPEKTLSFRAIGFET